MDWHQRALGAPDEDFEMRTRLEARLYIAQKALGKAYSLLLTHSDPISEGIKEQLRELCGKADSLYKYVGKLGETEEESRETTMPR